MIERILRQSKKAKMNDYTLLLESGNSFFDRLLKEDLNSRFSDKFEAVKCDVIKYHYPNYKRSRLKFILRFLFALTYRKINLFDIVGNYKSAKVLTINTQNYLYLTNIEPLTNRLKNSSIGVIQLVRSNSKQVTRAASFIDFFFVIYDLSFKLGKFPLDDIPLILYIYCILFKDYDLIYSELIKIEIKNIDLILSADPCDTFSRISAQIAREKSIKYFMLQSGPPDIESNEWQMPVCDLLCCWEEHKYFFEKHNIKHKSFPPPRFYYLSKNISNSNIIYDLFIFLTWVDNNKSGKVILNSMNELLNSVSKMSNMRIGVKFHPAQKNARINIPQNIKIVEDSVPAHEFIAASRKGLCFGSTVVYDCLQLNVPIAIINFAGQITTNSIFITFTPNVCIIKNEIELLKFIENPLKVDKTYSSEISSYDGQLLEEYIIDRLN